MKVIIFVIVFAVMFYVKWFSKWDSYKKIAFKSVFVYLSLGVSLITLIIFVQTVSQVYEEQKFNTLAHRLELAQGDAGRGDYSSLLEDLSWHNDYEPDFDYLWERVEMYECMNRYFIYGRTQEDAKQLQTLCRNPDFEENQPYGEHFLKMAGLSEQP